MAGHVVSDAVLIIDSDAVLATAVSFQRFESVSRQTRQIAQRFCRMKPSQFNPRLFTYDGAVELTPHRPGLTKR
jgi:hypothetical protein